MFKPLDAEARRIAIDAAQLYDEYRHTVHELRAYRGGMHWKTAAGRQYLFRGRDRRGNGTSLGRRSPETEYIYRKFHQRKSTLAERREALAGKIARQAKFCVAAGINRVPKVSADVVRVLDAEGLLGHNLIVLGTHALYAYEAASGVALLGGMVATGDIDLLLDVSAKLRLAGQEAAPGLLDLLRKADRSFEARPGDYWATNKHGFRVELVKPASLLPVTTGARGNNQGGFPAAEVNGLDWLRSVPKFTATVYGEDGMPVRFVVPDPRAFAVHKLWMSERPDRDPIKRTRDALQAKAVVRLVDEYLRLPFDEAALRVFPEKVRTRVLEKIEEIGANRVDDGDLPPGF